MSEHQPSSWTSYFFDLHILVPLSPIGIYILYCNKTYGAIFLIIYGTISWYFAGIMVRLMLTLAPIACILAGIAYGEILNTFMVYFKYPLKFFNSKSKTEEKESYKTTVSITSSIIIVFISISLIYFGAHCVFVASEAYSSPSIIMCKHFFI